MQRKIIHVDVSRMTIEQQAVPEEYAHLGGRGFTSTYLFRRVDPACHPLGPGNDLVFAPGLLAGTSLSSANRLSAGAKSPLTGGIKESNCGGIVAHRLARLGVKALVLTGKPAATSGFLGLRIAKNEISFFDASELQGHTIYDAAERLRARVGPRCGLLVIGPAGEMLLPTACISANDTEGELCRNLGRGGLGAVMGSKRIKAIVVDDTGCSGPIAVDGRVRAVIRDFAKCIRDNPVTGGLLGKYGTARNVLILNELGALPTRNFSVGRFESADSISGERLFDTISRRHGQSTHACMPGCVIRCSNKYVDESGRHIVGSLDYETIALLGANLGIEDLDQIAHLNRLCNETGIDTMETGVALGVLAEAGVLEFGDFDRIKALVEEVGKGSPLGRLVGCGSVSCARAFGVVRVPAVKGQGMAAYDPRVIKGMGVTYATSPMGADHTAGNAIVAGGDYTDPHGKIAVSRDLQITTAVLDLLGLCIFTYRPVTQNQSMVEQIVEAFCDWRLSFDELKELGSLILLRERQFNRLAGIGDAQDRLPKFFMTEDVPPGMHHFDISSDELESFFDFADSSLANSL